jgi:hexosaminidase
MKISIIPKPLKCEVKEGKSFIFNLETVVNGSASAIKELNEFTNKALGYTLNSGKDANIKFVLDPKKSALTEEGYTLDISDKGIEIKSSGEQGLFYGVVTLIHLIAGNMDNEKAELSPIHIEDKPRFRYRGYMLDSCRHFFPVEDVLKVIDMIALHKVNYFHWHLTEDQGWRIEIERYPRLTTVGARRNDTIGDGRLHGGFYSKADIKKVVDYCAGKHITVIPEIDLPGHSTAAAAAYSFLTCKGESLSVATTFGIKPDIFCAGKDSTYEFLYHVLDEIVEMFPGEYIHLGGDEAPKVRWSECPECQRVIKEQGLKGVEQLQGYFLNKLIEHLKSKGKKVICWNESIYSKILDKSVICQYWSDGKTAEKVVAEMNAGRTGIISKFSPYYLDYPFAMHSVKKAYDYSPLLSGLNDNADIMGIEAPLWTEYVVDLSKIYYMTCPRLGAVAETAWTSADNKNYDSFMERLPSFMRLLDVYHVLYAPIEDINPGPIKSFKQMLRFLKTMYSKEAVKAMREGAKAVKEMHKVREEI